MTASKEKLTVQATSTKAGESAMIRRISLVEIIGNILLSAFKLFAGIAGNSGAMVSDAVHSLSDVFAVAFASGLAKNGAKPVLCIVSSFLQRTFDQLLLDLSLDRSPATILVGNAIINPGDATHCGIYDIAMQSSIPNLIGLAPTTKEEYLAMFDWALEQTNALVVIREPSAVVSAGREVTFTDAGLRCYEVAERGTKVAFIGLGNFFQLAGQAKTALKDKAGIEATVINPRIYSTLDEKMLESLKAEHESY